MDKVKEGGSSALAEVTRRLAGQENSVFVQFIVKLLKGLGGEITKSVSNALGSAIDQSVDQIPTWIQLYRDKKLVPELIQTMAKYADLEGWKEGLQAIQNAIAPPKPAPAKPAPPRLSGDVFGS